MRKLSFNDVVYWLIVCMQSRFSLQKSGKMSMWQDGLLFADDFLYVKLMTEKSEKKMLCCKICLLCSLHRKFLFSQ
jgi:hypothetical protein